MGVTSTSSENSDTEPSSKAHLSPKCTTEKLLSCSQTITESSSRSSVSPRNNAVTTTTTCGTAPQLLSPPTSPSVRVLAAAVSGAQNSSSSASPHTVSSSSHGASVEKQMPTMRPNSDLLKVLHLAGGTGQEFTLGEIIHYVKEYISARLMYDQKDPRIVYCSGDLLGTALGVESFTVFQAIALFRKNCSMSPTTCPTTAATSSTSMASPRIQRHPQDEVDGHIVQCFPEKSTSEPTNSLGVAAHITVPFFPTESTQDRVNAADSSTMPSSLSSQASSQSSQQSSSAASSSLSSTMISFEAAKSSLTISETELRRHRKKAPARNTDSSSEGNEQDGQILRSRRREDGQGSKDSDRPRRASTSISVTYDDTDGAYGLCQVSLEAQEQDDEQPGEDNTVVFEYESDNFSVEYEVQSNSDVEEVESETSQQRRSERDDPNRLSSGSDSSSPRPRTALLVVCKESDVEYLADYSDSDTGSDAELSDADKWPCPYCQVKNPPFQRNCAGCWGVRPDWLPSIKNQSSEKQNPTDCPSNSKEPLQGGGDGTCFMSLQLSSAPPTMDTASPSFIDKDRAELQSVKSVKDNNREMSVIEGCADSISINHSHVHLKTEQLKLETFKKVVSSKKETSQKRKYSSCISTSDSQDEKSKEEKSAALELSKSSLNRHGNPASGERKTSGKHHLTFSAPSSRFASPAADKNDVCVVCLARPKTASIIHGKTGHQVCCYRCAKKLRKKRKPCPICRRPIQKVIRNYHL